MATEQTNIVYKDLSYKIIGVLMEVYNNLGSGHREIFYQKAIADELNRRSIQFKQQVRLKLFYKENFIGWQIVDFVIEDCIVLEIKKDEMFSLHHIKQVYSYLKILNFKLGILANFTKSGIKSKRILNLY